MSVLDKYIRQYKHNDGSGRFVFGYDKSICEYIESLQEEVDKIKGYRDECERQYQEKTEEIGKLLGELDKHSDVLGSLKRIDETECSIEVWDRVCDAIEDLTPEGESK